MKRLKTNGHTFFVVKDEQYWNAICTKCEDEYYFKKFNETKKDIMLRRAGCSFDHGYFCLINKQIKILYLSEAGEKYIEKIERCPITLSEDEFIVKNIIE